MQFEKNLSKPYVYYLFHFLISVILTGVFFWSVKSTQFIFTSDETLYLTRFHAFNSLFTHQANDLGVTNAVTLIGTLLDRLYYITTFFFTSHIRLMQIVLYFIKLVILLMLPFAGFTLLAQTYSKKTPTTIVFFISLWYSFNTLTLIYWQGNAFALTILASYALAPLALYFYHRSVFGKRDLKDAICTAILLFFMSFSLFLPAVFAIFLALYTALYAILNKEQWLRVCLSVARIFLITLPLSGILLIAPYDMFTTAHTTVNAVGGETYGSLQGGLLYQLFMWFSWPIYTYWEPRNIFSYYQYFFLLPVMLSPFVFYFLILKSAIRKKTKLLLTFLMIFLVFLFLTKGAQAPFGEIYLYLINKTPFFRIFRSPDNKFSFGIVLSLAVLLILIAKDYKKKVLICLLTVVTVLQFYPALRGIAIVGENTPYSSDRILQIPKEYGELVTFLNTQHVQDGYIMTLPRTEIYSHYQVGSKKHIGDDLLPKLIQNPFIYISRYSSMTNEAYNYFSSNDPRKLRNSPLRYIIIREDLPVRPGTKERLIIPTGFRDLYENRLFTVYENLDAKSLVESQNMKFKQLSPTKYKLIFKNIRSPQQLIFFENFNINWQLYPYDIPDAAYFFSKPIFAGSHTRSHYYANLWLIDPAEIRKLGSSHYSINSDGSVNFELILYFRLQSLFIAGSILSGTYLFILIIILLGLYVQKKK